MNCGNCGAPMRLAPDRRSYACDYCTSLYYPEESRDGVRVMDEPGELDCPSCSQVMSTHPYGGPGNIVVDNCPRCLLIWLDREELSKILQAPGRDRGAW